MIRTFGSKQNKNVVSKFSLVINMTLVAKDDEGRIYKQNSMVRQSVKR